MQFGFETPGSNWSGLGCCMSRGASLLRKSNACLSKRCVLQFYYRLITGPGDSAGLGASGGPPMRDALGSRGAREQRGEHEGT